MSNWYVYMVRCADKSLYTGITTDVDRRVDEHNSGKKAAAYTRSRRPVVITYMEKCKNRSAASKREGELKDLNKREKETMLKSSRQIIEWDGLAILQEYYILFENIQTVDNALVNNRI